jgi:beta-N-acetylhexosaminidase
MPLHRRVLLLTALSLTLLPAQQPVPSLETLSLHDRIAQLIVVRGYGDYPSPSEPEYIRFQHWIQDDHVGGFIVAGHIRNGNVIPAQPFEMAVFINHTQTQSTLPLLVASDFERGASMRVANTAHFPYQMAFGAARDLKATRDFGAATAREARALGVNWVFAPDADVNNNPANPVINTRSFGEDPAAVAENVAAFIDGAHSDPAIPILLSAKHFPGHGDTAEDSHMQLARLDQPKERIESLELVPFRAAIAHGVDSIMTAHLAVPALEPQRLPATLSHNILTNLLRDELNFKGIIVTDALEMKGVSMLFPEGEAAVRAIEAGADVLLMPTDPAVCIHAIEAAVASGRLTSARIDQSAAKILTAKQQLGLFQDRLVKLDQLTASLDSSDDESFKLAQLVANEAVTLVKDDKHLFPLPSTTAPCLIILGEGAFSSRGETLARYLKKKVPAFKIFPANSAMPDTLLSAYAAQTSQCKQIYAAAFVTVAANRGSVNLEGGLNGLLSALIRGPAPVALLSFGNPYLLKDFPAVAAYAATFSTADTSELAAAQAILGEIPITGKMPVSIPGLAKIGDGLSVPASPQFASKGSQ